MMGSFITRAIIMVFGYIYPAYECFKSVERNKPDIQQLRFWCQYWMIIAILNVIERLGDAFISWLPMYSEAKLAFIIYLWYPKTKGTTYVYMTFLKPFVSNHELEIDRHLNELRTRVGDMVCHYWQKGSVYAQSRFMELLQNVASKSHSSTPQQGQEQPNLQAQQPANHQPATAIHQTAAPPVLPTGYPARSPSPSRYVQQHLQDLNHQDMDMEVVGTSDNAGEPEPTMSAPVQRMRSRQRTRRQQ